MIQIKIKKIKANQDLNEILMMKILMIEISS